MCSDYTCLGVVPCSHFAQVAGFLSLGCGWGRRVNSMVSSTLWRSTQSCGGNHPPWFPAGLDTVVSNMGVVCDFRYAVRVCLPFVTFTRGCGVNSNTHDTLCFYSKLVSMLSRWTASFEPYIQSCTVDEHNFWTSGRRTRMWACLGCGPQCVPGRWRWKWVTTSAGRRKDEIRWEMC